LTYTPAVNFVGTDQFTFQAQDSSGASSQATVALTVQPSAAGPVPVGSADVYAVQSNGMLTVPATTGVLVNDTVPAGNHLVAQLKTAPAHGTLTAGLKGDGSFVYTPAPNFSGTDSFTYVPVATTAGGSVITTDAPVTVAIAVVAPITPAANTLVQFSGTHQIAPVTSQVEPQNPTPDPVADTAGPRLDNLVAPFASLSPGAIILPSFTAPGDETWSLMLPVAPELSQLPDALAAAMRRLTTRGPATISFVDPITGHHSDDIDPAAVPNPPWLLIDPDAASHKAAQPSRIRWDSHPT
ncbi:MAG: Ig-like domain-containing protein, partial [Mycobacterium sp.]|nr:Ig-like domain-containing protein [Mycobacterium sp.]